MVEPLAIRDPFPDNFIRLLGLHRLKAKEGAALLGKDVATMSLWINGKRKPSYETLILIADFFEVSVDGLARTEFGRLLNTELRSRQRYELVEKKIKR